MAETCRRASAHRIALTLPESSSSILREISWFHSSSAAASTVSSRVSRRAPASAARAAMGGASAFVKSSTTSFAIGLFYPGADARQQIPLKRKRQTLTGLPFRVPIQEPTAYFIAPTRLPSRDLYLAAVFPCSVPFWIALSSAETVWR